MKQCDNLAIASSSLPFPASESDPEDSLWGDFTFDFSFLTSDDQKSGLGDEIASLSNPDSTTVPKESDLTEIGEACSRNESAFSPLFAALRVKDEESVPGDTEVDSPCWKGALSKSRDDLSVLYGLNPMAPQFIPSNAKVKLGEANGSPTLKRSLSSTFPPSSSGISDQTNNTIGIIIHDADESLGLVCQDSVSEILDISQRRTKLDPLAPVFVPAYATERNASSEVGHIGSSNPPYSDNVHQLYSSNPRLGSQAQISENNTKLETPHGCLKKKLNPLAPQFSLADTKPKVYGSMENQAVDDLPTNVNSSVLFSPVSYRRNHQELQLPSVHVEPSYREDVNTKQEMGRSHRSYISHGNSSPQMDVKKLLTTIHGLSELLAHVHGSETSPNEQDLDLINSTVQNLNSYINNRVQETLLTNMCKQSIREHTIPKARNLSASVDFRRKEKYPMVLGEARAEPQVEYGLIKKNVFGQVVRSHETEEQINPQVLFYKSLWLKAKADRSLMEYETFLSSSRT